MLDTLASRLTGWSRIAIWTGDASRSLSAVADECEEEASMLDAMAARMRGLDSDDAALLARVAGRQAARPAGSLPPSGC